MKLIVLISLCVFYITLAVGQEVKPDGTVQLLSSNKVDLDKEWEDFKREHNKVYADKTEEDLRRKIFENKVKLINEQNKKFNLNVELSNSSDFNLGSDKNSENTFSLGLNEGSDLTSEEFFKKYLGLKAPVPKPSKYGVEQLENTEEEFSLGQSRIPDSFDWRSVPGVLGKIKNQKGCGSCWTFSSISTIEAQVKIKQNKVVVLSEQNLVDCVYSKRDGCNGGWMQDAYDYIIKNNGVSRALPYPYLAMSGKCRYEPAFLGAKIKSYKIVNMNKVNDELLKRAIFEIGPVAISVNTGPANDPESSLESFMNYKSGVYKDSKCAIGANHAVVAVGYGTEQGQDFFVIRNSWGESWGEKGYMRISRNTNTCGVGLYALYPIV